MRVTAVVSIPDQEVEVDISMEDIASAVMERNPESKREAMRGINHVYQYLSAIPEEFIAEMGPETRKVVREALAKQVVRFQEPT